MQNISTLLAFALDLVSAAAREILPRFHDAAVDFKADGSEVTEADRQAEAVMRERIREKYPSHGVLGEEGGAFEGTDPLQWILDPVDGTVWFTLGIPKFGTLVALLEDGRPRLGVVHLPVTEETLYAELGAGCWYRRAGREPERVRVDASVRTLGEAFVSSTGVFESEISPGARPVPWRMTEVIREAWKLRFVGDCVQHLLVARGRLHAALDPVMQPWDSAALVPCLLEAGGCVSTMDGDTEDVVFGGSLLTSCSPELHDDLLRRLRGEPK